MRREWELLGLNKNGPGLPTVPWAYPRNFRARTLAKGCYVVKVHSPSCPWVPAVPEVEMCVPNGNAFNGVPLFPLPLLQRTLR